MGQAAGAVRPESYRFWSGPAARNGFASRRCRRQECRRCRLESLLHSFRQNFSCKTRLDKTLAAFHLDRSNRMFPSEIMGLVTARTNRRICSTSRRYISGWNRRGTATAQLTGIPERGDHSLGTVPVRSWLINVVVQHISTLDLFRAFLFIEMSLTMSVLLMGAITC